MKITKFGQCCLLIEVNGKKILTDPGRFSVTQNEITGIDIILITHEHADHLHSASIEAIVQNNPEVKIVTNQSVGKILAELGISYSAQTEGRFDTCGVSLEAFPGRHVEIFEEFGQVENTGFFIADKLFYGGDAYINPGRPVPVLALPVAGPWCKLSEAVRYAIEVSPIHAFPVHDAVLNEDGLALTHGLFTTHLQSHQINFVSLKNGDMKEFEV